LVSQRELLVFLRLLGHDNTQEILPDIRLNNTHDEILKLRQVISIHLRIAVEKELGSVEIQMHHLRDLSQIIAPDLEVQDFNFALRNHSCKFEF